MRFLQITMSAAPRSGPRDPAQAERTRQIISEEIASGRLLAIGGLTKRELGAARVTSKSGEISVEDPPAGAGWLAGGGFALFEADSKEEAIARAKRVLETMGDGVVELIQVTEMYPAPKASAR